MTSDSIGLLIALVRPPESMFEYPLQYCEILADSQGTLSVGIAHR